MRNFNPYLLFFLFGFLGSCITTQELDYLQSRYKSEDTEEIIQTQKEEYRLQVDNILALNIFSRDKDLNNLFGSQHTTGVNAAGESSLYITGLTIDQDGYVEIPSIGRIYVLGLTLAQVKALIEKELYKIYKSDSVFVKLQLSGISYTIIGDVHSPGIITVYRNRLNIIEAIARAGDLNVTARRNKVKLIRDYPEGKKVVYLDLTKEEIINSPYFYIQPDDMIVVSHKPQKTLGFGTNFAGTISSIASVITTSLALFYTLDRL
ncbi:MAG: sugar transporter [Flavobacteriaceae bacterium]|nr:MAG: sugar transporter [Flavobacteriaceae bacterium]